jgi:hypothetical protein
MNKLNRNIDLAIAKLSTLAMFWAGISIPHFLFFSDGGFIGSAILGVAVVAVVSLFSLGGGHN